jgi:hypothetical protein
LGARTKAGMLCDRHGLLGFLLLFMDEQSLHVLLPSDGEHGKDIICLLLYTRLAEPHIPAGQIPSYYYCTDVMRSYFLPQLLPKRRPLSRISISGLHALRPSGRGQCGRLQSAEDHTILHTSSARTQRERPIGRFQRRFQRKSSILLHALALSAGPLPTGRSFCRT